MTIESINTNKEQYSTIEIQKNVFSIWFQSSVLNGQKRRQYRIPSKISELPCGCCRTRTYEADPNNT